MRGRYRPEFKVEAVRLVKGGERPATAAKNLGLAEQRLHNWIKASDAGSPKGEKTATVSKGQMKISRLPANLSRIKMERGILK